MSWCLYEVPKNATLNVKFELVVGRSHYQTYKFVDASYPHRRVSDSYLRVDSSSSKGQVTSFSQLAIHTRAQV